MEAIGATIGEYILPHTSLQSMASFMRCVIQQFEIFCTALGSNVNVEDLQTPNTDLVRTEIISSGLAQQLQENIEGQKLFKYSNDFGQVVEKGVNTNITGDGSSVAKQQISQALGLEVLGNKELKTTFNNTPNTIENLDYIQTSLENLVSIGTQGERMMGIIKNAKGERYVQSGKISNPLGQKWDESTNKALAVLQPSPYNLTKHQSEVTATVINRATAVNKVKNENLATMEQRQVEINDRLSSPTTSVVFSLPRVENYGETIVGGVADTAMSLDTSDEELKYIRSVAQREAINNCTTAQIAVDFINNATINSDLDIDLVMNKFTEKLREAVDTCAEGVNYCV